MSHLEEKKWKREKEKTDQFKGSHDKMRYNSTGRLQLALDVYYSANPHISLNTDLLIVIMEEKDYQG